MSGNGPLTAIVFDFDGVIADTEPLHHQAFCRVVTDDGLDCSWDEYVRDYIGFDDRDLFRAAYRSVNRTLEPDELEQRIRAKADAFIALTEGGVKPYDGIPELVHDVASRYPIALCSGALRSDIDPILKQLELTDIFLTRVTAEDVKVSKPDPACYRLTVLRLNEVLGRTLDASTCLAIEDTPGGIEAAKGAGLRVWGVTHTHGATDIGHADRVFESLHEVRDALDEE